MRCLSMWEPWCTLMAGGLKKVETRGPHLAGLKPGLLVIHAAKRWTAEQSGLCCIEPFRSALAELGVKDPAVELPFGCIVGAVSVRAVVPTGSVGFDHQPRFFSFDSTAGELVVGGWERAFGDYTPGRVAVVTLNPHRFAFPQEMTGRQGLFEIPLSTFEKAVRGV